MVEEHACGVVLVQYSVLFFSGGSWLAIRGLLGPLRFAMAIVLPKP